MKTPFWKGLKADLKENVEPAIVGFGVAFGNVLKGMAGVIDAFLPHMDGIAKRSDSITGSRSGGALRGRQRLRGSSTTSREARRALESSSAAS